MLNFTSELAKPTAKSTPWKVIAADNSAFIDPARHARDENGSLVHLDDPLRIDYTMVKAWIRYILDPRLPNARRFCFIGTVSRHQAGQVPPPATIQFDYQVQHLRDIIPAGNSAATEQTEDRLLPATITSPEPSSQAADYLTGNDIMAPKYSDDARPKQPQESIAAPGLVSANLATLGCPPHARDQSDDSSDGEPDDATLERDDKMDLADDEEQDGYSGAPTFTLSPKNNVKACGNSLPISFSFSEIALAVPSRSHG